MTFMLRGQCWIFQRDLHGPIYSMTKEQVKAQEEAMFEEYLKIYSQHKPD